MDWWATPPALSYLLQVLRGLYSTITLAVYGEISDSTPDQLARQGEGRGVKEEEPLLPSTPQGTESYAAQWTEQHKQVIWKSRKFKPSEDGLRKKEQEDGSGNEHLRQVALKAEPPDGWSQDLGPELVVKVEPDVRTKVMVGPSSPPGRPASPPGQDLSPRANSRTHSPRRADSRTHSPRRANSRTRSPRRADSRTHSPRAHDSRPHSPNSRAHSPRRAGSRTSWKKYSGDGFRRSGSWERNGGGSVGGRESRERSVGREGSQGSRDRSPRELRGRSPSRDRRSLGSRRSRSRTPELVLHYSKSREASLERYRSRSPPSRNYRRNSRDERDSLGSRPGGRSTSPRGSGRTSRSSLPSPRSRERRSLGSLESRSRNGCRSPEQEQPREDILDNVSDISDGDIPDLPEAEMEETPTSVEAEPEQEETKVTVREDVEEISDEEAEWSDDLETANMSDLEQEIGEGINWEQFDGEVITVFNSKWMEHNEEGLTSLSCPTESLSDRVRLGKAPGGEGGLEEQVKVLLEQEVDERWVEGVESVTRLVQQEFPSCSGEQEIVENLLKVALLATDFQRAMEQPKPSHKVRHIKSGLRMVVELLSCGQKMRQVKHELEDGCCEIPNTFIWKHENLTQINLSV